jgi:hypothetical protein
VGVIVGVFVGVVLGVGTIVADTNIISFFS